MADPADRFALQDVMSRYAAGVDERDFDLYASVFDDEVEVVGFTPETVHGRDAWVAYVREALGNYDATQHMLGPVYAEIDGDRAHCRTDVQALHYMAGTEDDILTLWATYRSDMRRDGDSWRIVRHELVRRGIRRS